MSFPENKVVFSYIFGGFGLDIAGHSILQINEFNKAALQFLGLIFFENELKSAPVTFGHIHEKL